ncbi:MULTISPECIES: RadC family protein [Olivibacter]|jgi:DNA repair protein RadC|uniref:DNA repair protein RadC n=3 Tax=Sphingobacteriaceae TaxID=84566 RepID=F4C4D8_SPHS2|nr:MULTISPECIES: DNA repair protein RadC [Olivibacter]MCL4639876.1 DNA repair protein RadC [Olivibacter sp. UJ_SKK_5.1]MDM8175688.1 DNA repair protein RadC [Olivibacter sp. 47]MDX3914297.1 DNA repair protein RadC [Pseudosphingobacterium sp.]QEL02425.1 DNA repair protein RadC [Olivibacter sp. LS-1]
MQETYTKRMRLKQWAEQDRPREKLLLNGRRLLSDAELIAILIGSGSKEETAVELSKRILSDVENNLSDLARLTLADLCNYKGIGEAKAIAIIAALELGRRRKENASVLKPQIESSEDAYQVLQSVYADLSHEEFWILLLNTNNRVIAKELISKGGSGVVAVDAKGVFQAVLQAKATGLILSHNHPSGSLRPSMADKQLTKKIVEGGKLLDVRVLDHLIISDEGYYSFLDHGDI